VFESSVDGFGGSVDLLDQSPGEEEPQENEAEDFRPDEEDSK